MAFYLPLGDGVFRATGHTVGPCDPAHQHAGPPSALAGRALEPAGGAGMRIVRISVDVLGPVPVADLTVATRILRPGRSVELAEAELSAGGRPVLRATAWRMRTADAGVPADPQVAPGPPEAAAPAQPAVPPWNAGYLDAMEWRWVRGSFTEPGAAAVWARMTVPLVDGEEPSPVQRILVLADSGNGASGRLDPGRWLFVNPELTVHLFRPADCDWILLDAETSFGGDGTGLATSVMSDRRGIVARGAQALFVAPRD